MPYLADHDGAIGPAAFQKLIRDLRGCSDSLSLDRYLHRLIATVRIAIQHRFHDPHLAEDATISACRVVVDRLRKGHYAALRVSSELERLLVKTAWRIALRQQKRQRRETTGPAFQAAVREAIGSTVTLLHEITEKEDKGLLESECKRLRDAVCQHLNSEEQIIFQLGLRRDYGAERISAAQMAAAIGRSQRTVRRRWDKVQTVLGRYLPQFRARIERIAGVG